LESMVDILDDKGLYIDTLIFVFVYKMSYESSESDEIKNQL